jgi:hypothetical protein
MNFAQFLGAVVVNSLLNRGNTLTWQTVQAWITQNSSRDNINRGFASFSPWTGSTTGNSYVELRKDSKGSKGVRVTASVHFDKRQGPAFTKTWDATKLDSELEKMFGKNLRTRISI